MSESLPHTLCQSAKNPFLATLLSESFAIDCPVTTDGDYISSQVTGFPNDEDDNSQRVGGLASMPVTNGVRYHAPQSAMQDLQYVIFLSSFPFFTEVSIRTALALHSAFFQHNSDIPSLVAALPPGPGSLDFSPACFGTFHTDLLRACVLSDVSVVFLSELVSVSFIVIFFVQCLLWSICGLICVFTHHGLRAVPG